MKNFWVQVLINVSSSLIVGGLSLAFSDKFPLSVLILLLSIVIVIFLFGVYIAVINICSKNPLRKILKPGMPVTVMPNYEQVYYDGVVALKPNFIRYKRNNGSYGIAHFKSVIIYV